MRRRLSMRRWSDARLYPVKSNARVCLMYSISSSKPAGLAISVTPVSSRTDGRSPRSSPRVAAEVRLVFGFEFVLRSRDRHDLGERGSQELDGVVALVLADCHAIRRAVATHGTGAGHES